MPKLFITLLLALGAIVTGIFYLRPEWEEFQSLRQENQNLQELNERLDQIIRDRDSLLSRMRTISSEDMERIDRSIPLGPQGGELLVTLEVLALRKGLSIKNIDLQLPRTEPQRTASSVPRADSAETRIEDIGSLKDFPLTIGVEGSYEQLKNFLLDLQSQGRIIDIQSVSFSSLDAGSRDRMQFSISARTYYQ